MLSFFCAILKFICITQGSIAYLAHGEDYNTIWRGYIDVYGTSASVPLQFEAHALRLAATYKGIGIGTSAFKLYAKDLLGSDFESEHKFIAFFAPVYVYYIPFATDRRTGDITPLVFYSYLGGSAWGLKQAKFIDLGIGFNYYLLDLRVGFNGIKAESRNCFYELDVNDDYPVSWNKLYISANLSTGYWLAIKSKQKNHNQKEIE